MATKFVTNLDLNQNQILKGRFEALTADPSTNLFEGWIYYNTVNKVLRYYDGSEWLTLFQSVVSGGAASAALSITEGADGTVTITPNLANSSNPGVLSPAFYDDLNNATSSETPNTLAKRDASGRIKVAAPSNDLDAANKAYVDAARSGLDVKQSVRVATASALPAFTRTGNVLAANGNGALIVDGVTLIAGDRVLVKDEISGNAPFNGIYSVTATGGESDPWELTRATDADSNDEVTAGMFTFVAEGVVNADAGFVLTTDDVITLGTTPLAFAQFSGAGQITAGDGLTKSGNTINVVGTADRIVANADSIDIASTYVGQTSITTLGTITTGVWNGTDVAVADGGTGASDASTARTNLGATSAGFTTSTPVLARVAAQTVGNGADVTFTITHNFGTRDVTVQVYDAATYDTVIADTVRSSTNAVAVSFSSAPTSNAYRVVVTG